MLLSLYSRLQVLRSSKGATAVEYGLLVAVIAMIMVVGAAFLGQELSNIFDRIGDELATYTF